MSRLRDLERDRQIADVRAIFAKSRTRDDEPDDVDEGEVASVELTGFGDGYQPPSTAWRARLDPRRRPVVVFAAVALLTAAATAMVTWFLRPVAIPVSASTPAVAANERSDDQQTAQAAQSGAATTTPAVLVVAVVGRVANPGLVTLPEGSRVSDAIAAAGGALPDTDLTTINIARKVTDGEQIVVGIPGVTGDPAAGADAGSAQTGPINLNTANVSQLDELPGIGPVLAQRIVDHRDENGPFKTVGELINVSGVGPSILEKLQDLVTV